MRLCFITREYPPLTPYSGGIGSQYAALAPELARQGHEVHVLSFVKRPRQFVQEGVFFHLAPFSFWHLNNLARALAADRKLRSLDSFDVVYAAEWGGDAWRYSAHQRIGPLVTNLQISLAQVRALSSGIRGLGRLAPRVLITERLEREQAERSTGIVGCSEAVLRWASELWRLDRVAHCAVLPNTTNVRRVRTYARQGDTATGFPSNGPVVAFSGRLEPRKGVAVLARAMREVWREQPTVRLVLLGRDFPLRKGTMSDYVLDTAGEFARNVYVLPNQAPETLFPSLAAADVVALPSLWEAFGIAALEAMALGKAVVLTSGSGYDDFATHDHNALLVRPGSAHALAQAILRLLGHSGLRARLGLQAARSADRLDVPAVARAHGEYFAALRNVRAGSTIPVQGAR